MNYNAYGIKLYIAPVRHDELPAGDIYTEIFANDLADALKQICERMNVGNYSAIVVRRKA